MSDQKDMISRENDEAKTKNDQYSNQLQTFSFIDISNIKKKDFAFEVFKKILDMIIKNSDNCSPRLKALNKIDFTKNPYFFTPEFQEKLQFLIFQFLMCETNEDFNCSHDLGILLLDYFERDPCLSEDP